jgi:hypothetical protein
MSRHSYDTIIIRTATAADRDVARLAALDSRRVPSGDVLVAEADGEARAALSLSDGSLVADPFSRTEDLATLLRLHSSQRPARREARAIRPRRRLVARAA